MRFSSYYAAYDWFNYLPKANEMIRYKTIFLTGVEVNFLQREENQTEGFRTE